MKLFHSCQTFFHTHYLATCFHLLYTSYFYTSWFGFCKNASDTSTWHSLSCWVSPAPFKSSHRFLIGFRSGPWWLGFVLCVVILLEGEIFLQLSSRGQQVLCQNRWGIWSYPWLPLSCPRPSWSAAGPYHNAAFPQWEMVFVYPPLHNPDTWWILEIVMIPAAPTYAYVFGQPLRFSSCLFFSSVEMSYTW